jgi:hypothetical protein
VGQLLDSVIEQHGESKTQSRHQQRHMRQFGILRGNEEFFEHEASISHANFFSTGKARLFSAKRPAFWSV